MGQSGKGLQPLHPTDPPATPPFGRTAHFSCAPSHLTRQIRLDQYPSEVEGPSVEDLRTTTTATPTTATVTFFLLLTTNHRQLLWLLELIALQP